MKNTGLILIIFLSLVLLNGCASNTRDLSSEFAPLRARGIQVLSTNNPYHGPNILLAKAIEDSPTLSGYFQNNGMPTAIEVRGSSKWSEEILLYYPKDYKVFVARRVLTKPKNVDWSERIDWIVDGPYGIGKRDFRLLRTHYERQQNISPVLTVWGNKFNTNPTIQVASRTPLRFEPEVPLIVMPKPKPKIITHSKKTSKTSNPNNDKNIIKSNVTNKSKNKSPRIKLPKLDDPKFNPINMDQRALLESKGYAARASNGDILHPIEGGAQDLNNIADWYMGSPALLAELQEANRIPEAQTSAKRGVTIRIPLEFAKRTLKMPLNHRAPKVSPIVDEKNEEDTKNDKPAAE